MTKQLVAKQALFQYEVRQFVRMALHNVLRDCGRKQEKELDGGLRHLQLQVGWFWL